jgi:hypothetical protein
MQRVKSIKFNLTNPFEKELFEYVTKMDNFSGYIKELIKKDTVKQKKHVIRANEKGIIKIQL